MPVSVFAISAPVKKTTAPAGEGEVVVRAEYTALGLYPSWEDALMVAVPMVEERFSFEGVEGQATIRTLSGGSLREIALGYTTYAPLGLSEVPLLVIKTHDMDIDLEAMEKFFLVPASSIKE